MEAKYKEFAEKLQKLSEETGVWIEEYGDAYYNPKLTTDPKTHEAVRFKHGVKDGFLELNTEGESPKYLVRTGNPYDGAVIE